MRDVLRAFARALRSLARRGVLVHLLWPSVLALGIWSFVAFLGWNAAVEGLSGWVLGWAWVGGWIAASEFAAAITLLLIKFTLGLALLPLIYVTAALLVAVIALPMMLERVAREDYADLEQRRGGSNAGSAWNACVAGILFLLGMVLSLPVWLIPGGGLVASIALTGWLNQKAFGYDALMLHADREEIVELPKRERSSMLLLGGGCALLAYVPFVNILAPAFCGLAFVHYMLETLRRTRLERGVAVLDPVALAGHSDVRK